MAHPVTHQARRLRASMTEAERVLWRRLRHDQLGVRFRRQHPLGRYVTDFVCLPEKLVVEVDGGQHDWRAGHDRQRDTWLTEQGFTVLRFWNHEALRETDAVVDRILAHLRAG